MNPQIKKRLMRTAGLAAIALFIGAGIGFVQMSQNNNPNAQVVNKTTMAGVPIGGPFTLVNQDGQTVTEKNFENGYKLVYFGFTMCPMICPTGLQKIAKTLNEMGEDGKAITPILITVDPERDTPQVMKEYVQQFHPQMVGLTGSKEQVDSVVKEYRVFAAKVNDEELTDYTMDHSSFTYLMSPDNRLIALYRDSDTAEFMAKDIKEKIGGDA
jgi:protein SCO1/2